MRLNKMKIYDGVLEGTVLCIVAYEFFLDRNFFARKLLRESIPFTVKGIDSHTFQTYFYLLLIFN